MSLIHPTADGTAQWAHVGWGYIFVTAPVALIHLPLIYSVLIAVAIAAAKELWDAYGGETAIEAGSSWRDFGFYCVGIALGAAVIR